MYFRQFIYIVVSKTLPCSSKIKDLLEVVFLEEEQQCKFIVIIMIMINYKEPLMFSEN